MPTTQVVDDAGVNYLEITFRRLTGGTGDAVDGYAAAGVSYTVECSQTMGASDWNTGSEYLEQTGAAVDNGDGTETVTVRVKVPVGNDPRKFIRVMIQEEGP